MTRIDGYLLGPRRTDAAPTDTPPHPTTPQGSAAAPGRRSDALCALFDATTFRHLDRLGVGPGWRCWEVGADGTSVLSWLAKRVGPTGRVLGTDVDPTRASAAARPPIEVVRHDVGTQEPPGDGFDLVHARLVLAQVPERGRALRSLVKALRPGGRLLVEEADTALQPLACPDEYSPAQQLANRLRHGLRAVLAERGTDLSYGRRLPRLLREAGLAQVGADACFPLAAPAAAAWEVAQVTEVRDRLVAGGFAAQVDVDRHLARVESGALDLATAPLISAWGRKQGAD